MEKYNIKTDIQKVVCAWKKLTGYKVDDRQWDKAHFSRHSKTAKNLIEFLGGYKNAIDCMEDIYTKMKKHKLSCTIDTVLKHSADWKIKMEKEELNERA